MHLIKLPYILHHSFFQKCFKRMGRQWTCVSTPHICSEKRRKLFRGKVFNLLFNKGFKISADQSTLLED